ncbi:MAG: cysteine hydrolase [Chloroflexi bacterium]|nr:cysteine hydrolase [Chloroflexota bacterium]
MPNVVLVVDMLRGFLEEGHNLYCGDDARKIIPSVQAILERELAEGSKVFYICDTHLPDDLEFQIFPVHCVEGTVESEIIPELSAYTGERINKQRYSGFYNTDLDKQLRELDPEKIIVCGVCTDICVLHTTADARNRDYTVEVPSDAVATFDPNAHVWALQHMERILGAKLVIARPIASA